jgi:hypothetical protein
MKPSVCVAAPEAPGAWKSEAYLLKTRNVVEKDCSLKAKKMSLKNIVHRRDRIARQADGVIRTQYKLAKNITISEGEVGREKSEVRSQKSECRAATILTQGDEAHHKGFVYGDPEKLFVLLR